MNHIDTVEQMFQDAKNLYEDKVIDGKEFVNILRGLDVQNAITMGIGDEAFSKKKELQAIVEKTITEVSLTA
jgi:hypothetical protein